MGSFVFAEDSSIHGKLYEIERLNERGYFVQAAVTFRDITKAHIRNFSPGEIMHYHFVGQELFKERNEWDKEMDEQEKKALAQEEREARVSEDWICSNCGLYGVGPMPEECYDCHSDL